MSHRHLQLLQVACTVLQDVSLTQQWLLALARAGYQFPALQNTGLPRSADAGQSQTGAAAVHVTTLQHKVLNTTGMASKWAVFTASKAPTDAIKGFAALEGWRVVVVADETTPEDWSWPNVTLLTLQQQQALGYSILKHMPLNNHA